MRFDPNDFEIGALPPKLRAIEDRTELETMLAAEVAGRNRTTVQALISSYIDRVSDDDDGVTRGESPETNVYDAKTDTSVYDTDDGTDTNVYDAQTDTNVYHPDESVVSDSGSAGVSRPDSPTQGTDFDADGSAFCPDCGTELE